MPLFRCFIRGENFPGQLIGHEEPVGFYATRFVEAETLEKAEMLAIERLRKDPDLMAPPEHLLKQAMVYFEDIDEVPADTVQTPDAGFTFFMMDN